MYAVFFCEKFLDFEESLSAVIALDLDSFCWLGFVWVSFRKLLLFLC